MSGFQQAKKREQQADKTVRGSDAHLHWAAAQAPSYVWAANGASQGNRSEVYPGSISQGPPPSFLTRTPLGVREGEAVDYLARSQTNPVRQQGSSRGSYSSPIKSAVGPQPDRLSPVNIVSDPKGEVALVQRAPANGVINRLGKEEIRLSMSKMSIMSLILGFLFLGVLFFIIGFLAAVGTLKSETVSRSSPGAWEASNTSQDQKKSGKGGKIGALGGAMGGLLGNVVGKELAPLEKAIGGVSKNVPAPLQPFARYGVGSARTQVRSSMNAANPFATHHGHAQQPVQPYGGGPQQPYGGQPYSPQNMGQPQGPYVQQPMMQQQMPGQPYYPQRPQQMPQQQMGAYPQGNPQAYPPQPIAPQQGYYR